jgi:hypothetical protein
LVVGCAGEVETQWLLSERAGDQVVAAGIRPGSGKLFMGTSLKKRLERTDGSIVATGN